ncbi:alpha/beta hydrolase [Fastidiosibacter lacustris]|uniref:alpha/beta hydrolase n=1 Tax=Fastidiosibacter lacustris TaxID=2056695 RepID=UPI000E34A3D6|nr:alpha/beta fold hydrolase [Fastidiosibacter lacustris]
MSHFFIHGSAGMLEATLDTPKNFTCRDKSVVICHPHPLFQGTMNNKVITTISQAFNNLGIEALRFNYRGVGKSQGSYGGGDGELEDALSIIDHIHQNKPNQKIILAGFSFGGAVAYKAAMRREADVLALLTIAPAVVNFPLSNYPEPSMAWCLVQGIDDEVVSYHEVCKFFINQTSHDATLIRLNNVGHFFHGQLVKLRKQIERYYQPRVSQW